MTIKYEVMTYSVLVCDGCAVTYPEKKDDENHLNPISVRAAAYGAGWRYPSRINVNGLPARDRASDVCPACIDGWTPRPTNRTQTDK
jgi:hypothetical protein